MGFIFEFLRFFGESLGATPEPTYKRKPPTSITSTVVARLRAVVNKPGAHDTPPTVSQELRRRSVTWGSAS